MQRAFAKSERPLSGGCGLCSTQAATNCTRSPDRFGCPIRRPGPGRYGFVCRGEKAISWQFVHAHRCPAERRPLQQTVSQPRPGSVSRCIPADYGRSSPCGCKAWRPLKPSPTRSPRYLNASGGWLRKVLPWRPMRSMSERAFTAQILNQQGEYALALNGKQGNTALRRGSAFRGSGRGGGRCPALGSAKNYFHERLSAAMSDDRTGRCSASDSRILPHCALNPVKKRAVKSRCAESPNGLAGTTSTSIRLGPIFKMLIRWDSREESVPQFQFG
jgi:hypothetical protein